MHLEDVLSFVHQEPSHTDLPDGSSADMDIEFLLHLIRLAGSFWTCSGVPAISWPKAEPFRRKVDTIAWGVRTRVQAKFATSMPLVRSLLADLDPLRLRA